MNDVEKQAWSSGRCSGSIPLHMQCIDAVKMPSFFQKPLPSAEYSEDKRKSSACESKYCVRSVR